MEAIRAADPYRGLDPIHVFPPFSALTRREKAKRVLVNLLKTATIVGLLYLFVCSLDLLSSSFRLIGGKAAGDLFKDVEVLRNPIVGVMLGILVTVLVQSSSTSTSIVVSMVAAGILTVPDAIPIVMGANIGTSVTNTLVALVQLQDRNQFRRAFAGATVHDMFNWLTVIALLFVEVTTGEIPYRNGNARYLEKLTGTIVASLEAHNSTGGNVELLKVLTKPFSAAIVQVRLDLFAFSFLFRARTPLPCSSFSEHSEGWNVDPCSFFQLDKNVLMAWSVKDSAYAKYANATSLLKSCKKLEIVTTVIDTPSGPRNATELITKGKCYLLDEMGLDDVYVGLILLVFSILLLCGCLIAMVKILHSLFQGSIARVIRNTINEDIPYVPWLTGYLAILIGCGLTVIVQSSSVFTSVLTPLVGLGAIRIERMYPLTLGSNIGTTTTALLASLAADAERLRPSIQISLCHLFFNLSGIALFYVVPFMRFPIHLAKILGNTCADYRWFAGFYLIFSFVLLPVTVFGLSLAGTIPLVVVGLLVVATLAFVIALNLFQRKCPESLPKILRTWHWLPEPLRSLEPYDRAIGKMCFCCKCCAVEIGGAEERKPVIVASSRASSSTSTLESMNPNMESTPV
ncbi:unnamed protein product [Darwinula stevensoni]|uniref:Uncharacterized protein n=1 Tax=Darwinula stevensoni TaxID=69355 RepID=A0A7R9FRF8_9CRUS|nr:unnamed protein product [Darwinula stevensoni]CAG0901236.1 unnamed protein product [Darwinula stevensoni]